MDVPPKTLIITRKDVARVTTPRDFRDAVEQAFRAAASGKANSPHPMHLPTRRGGFHAKGASISLDRDYVAVKVNANFPGNPGELGLPTIQGAVLLFDGANGALLAIIDSIEVTLGRTAAASALAAQRLARPDSQTLLICGAGEQGRAHVAAIRDVLPIQRCLVWDRDHAVAQGLADYWASKHGMTVTAVQALTSAALSADVIACCTSAREAYLEPPMVKPGTFIAAVGTDSPDKSEISPALMASSTVVTDVLKQCAEMGDLRHAIRAGLMTTADVHADLGEVIVGTGSGRRSNDEIIVFDSTGTGLQDVGASGAIYERCKSGQSSRSIALGAA